MRKNIYILEEEVNLVRKKLKNSEEALKKYFMYLISDQVKIQVENEELKKDIKSQKY